ncbi:MAG: LLM class flavin-dependent oxidoreductase [Planctomycetota bacterium]|jgi:5,10-methylenetetrahydromethanopterin reductase
MEFGIALASTVDAWKTVKRAEELGFTHAWFYDTQMLCADLFVSMTGAALSTTRIRLGTGVLVPSNRIAPVTANALASLAKLAPGRIDFGVGTGFTARRTMGLGAIPLGDLDEYVRIVRALLAGETVEWDGDGKRRKIRFLNPEAGLTPLPHPIPLHISAFGPRARTLTAKRADGWINFVTAVPLASLAAEQMAAACREGGRNPESLYRTAFTLGCVLEPGEPADGARARAQAAPLAMVALHSFVEQSPDITLPPPLGPAVAEYRKLYESYEPADARYLELHTGHLMRVRPDEERFAQPDLIRALTLTGTSEEIRDRIQAIEGGGYNQLAIQLVPGHESALEDWARVVEKL